ncbi:MAG: hypothetical protein QOG23_2360 [Blastocatellia bacterium]|jgi:hypothetical protein|nr:hypothetical protein [Blastocatellia bacterium]
MDASWITLATGLIAGLGMGSVITAQIQHALRIKEAAHESRRRDLEARYKVIILLMYAAYDFTGNETAMRIHRPDLKTQTDVLNDLRAEWTNMLLFASKTTLDSLRIFMADPTAENLAKCAVSMRVDLGRDSVDLETLNLNLIPNNQSMPPEKRL